MIPYWIKGDSVQEVAVDILTRWLKVDDTSVTKMFPDIPINILYSPGDNSITKENALVLWHQLKKTGQFTDIRLKRGNGGSKIFGPQNWVLYLY